MKTCFTCHREILGKYRTLKSEINQQVYFQCRACERYLKKMPLHHEYIGNGDAKNERADKENN